MPKVITHTGSTSMSEQRITRPVGALGFIIDKPLVGLTTETITIWIEGANGRNVPIATNVPLKDVLVLANYGTAVLIGTPTTLQGYVELANGGAIELQDNESLKFSMSGLEAIKSYEVNAVEFPVKAETVKRYERKVMNSDEDSRKFGVSEYDVLVFEGSDNITGLTAYYENGESVKFDNDDLKFVAQSVDPVFTFGASNIVLSIADYQTFPLDGVESIDIQKGAGSLKMTMLSNGVLY